MKDFMMAFGWASIMLAIGVFCRAKVPFFRNMLVPSSVIAGIIGFVFMNVSREIGMVVGTEASMYTTIVNGLFTISFISISLTNTPKNSNETTRNVLRGALGMGLVWCLLYALTPVIGGILIKLVGGGVEMDKMYGTLIPFAFTQGPGQAMVYGGLYEDYGWENASTVAVTFAAIGFICAFLIGIPAAKLGIKRKIAKNSESIDDKLLKGYYKKEEQTEYMIKDTTNNSNIETLTYHFVLIGVSYVLAVVISKIWSLIPGFFGTSMSSLMFMNGMFAAYFIKYLMKKTKIDFLQENILQSKITGWTTDYLVVCSFMSVNITVIKQWAIPILVECVVITVVTFVICFYFGARFGDSNDFERTLGIYGAATGTVPTGIALVRIVDPQFRTSTSVELGLSNLVMLLSTPVYLILLATAAGEMTFATAMLLLLGFTLLYIVLLKLVRVWGKPTYRWRQR
ncbi:sodium:glutamate symporter [Lachnospiraceae bacterium OttesenSCG-928-D06]|nr:sodium:glutamate symporter [Lachnospiraceae bacterium OttesenSCG-928-D06]